MFCDFISGHTTVATAGTCVAVVTSESYAPNGVLFSVVDSAVYYIQSTLTGTVGDDLRTSGVVCKNNNPIFIHTNSPNTLLVDCASSDKDISWCIM